MVRDYIKANKSQNCGFSDKIEHNAYKNLGEGTQLIRRKYSTTAKPWNIHISIHLNPPFRKLSTKFGRSYPRLWFPNYMSEFPASIDIHVIVDEKLDVKNSLHVNDAVNYLKGGQGAWSTYFQDVVYYTSSKILNLHQLSNDINAPPNKMLNVSVLYSEYILTLLPYICKILEHQSNQLLEPGVKLEDKWNSILLEIWVSHLGNYTMNFVLAFQYGEWINPEYLKVNYCAKFRGNGKIPFDQSEINFAPSVVFNLQLKSSTAFNFGHLTISKSDSDLRFVSCGTPDFSPLAFRELVRIFDPLTWCVILATFISIILITKHVGSNLNMVYFVIKVVFEQGNPLSNRLLRNNFTAIIGVIIMLVGMVLTNAYKNDNVYNMVLPRVALPRQYFRQLFDKNFEIFARSLVHSASLSYLHKVEEDYVQNYKLEYPNATMLQIKTSFRENELKNLVDPGHQTFEIYDYTTQGDLPKEALDVQKISKHIPNILNLFVDSYYNYDPEQASKYYLEEQTSQMMNLLRKCNNTAIILPYNQAVRLVRQQQRQHADILDIGIETYFRSSVVLTLHGTWPMYVIRRQTLLKGETGILQKWTNLLNETTLSSNAINLRNFQPTGAKMSGNIFVIFLVYFVGIGLTIGLTLIVSFALYILKQLQQINMMLKRRWKNIVIWHKKPLKVKLTLIMKFYVIFKL